LWQIVVGVIVLFVYGSVLLERVARDARVSWQGTPVRARSPACSAAYLLSGPNARGESCVNAKATNPYLTS